MRCRWYSTLAISLPPSKGRNQLKRVVLNNSGTMLTKKQRELVLQKSLSQGSLRRFLEEYILKLLSTTKMLKRYDVLLG